MKCFRVILSCIHSVIFWLFFIIITLVLAPAGWIIGLAALPFGKKQEVMYACALLWVRLLLLVAGVRITVSGGENLENYSSDKPRLFVCNHQGAFDIPVLMACLPRFAFVAKRILFRAPVFGSYMKGLGYIAMERESVKAADAALTRITELLKSGMSVIMFPEGTRTRTGKLGRYRRGPLKAAREAGVSIQPCVVDGSFDMMKKGSLLIKPAKINLVIGTARKIPADICRAGEKQLCDELRHESGLMMRDPDFALNGGDIPETKGKK